MVAHNDSLDLRTLKEEVTAVEKPVFTAPVKPTVPRQMEIELRYSDPDGTNHVGVVMSNIKTGQQRVQVGQMAAQLSNGVPWASLPPMVAARVWALANVTVQLIDPPEWVLQWVQEDAELLFGIANQLEEHESTYFRGHPEQGTANANSQRMVIRKKDSSAYTGQPVSPNAT